MQDENQFERSQTTDDIPIGTYPSTFFKSVEEYKFYKKFNAKKEVKHREAYSVEKDKKSNLSQYLQIIHPLHLVHHLRKVLDTATFSAGFVNNLLRKLFAI